MSLSPLHILEVLTRRLEVTNISRKSAQVIPFVWSTIKIYDDDSIFYVIGLPSCSCPWLQKLPQFCGLFLVHRTQRECPECGSPIEHLPKTIPYIKRLVKVAVSMTPLQDLVKYIQRSRRVITTNQPIRIQIGRELCILQYTTKIDQETFEATITPKPKMYIARIIIIASNVRLTVRSASSLKRTPDVIYSDGVTLTPTLPDSRESYVSITRDEPVIFSIAGSGAVIDLVPLYPQENNMILYELTTITGEGTTTIHSPPHEPIELFREIYRLVEMTPAFSSSPQMTLMASVSLIHSSSSFVQNHRLRMQRDRVSNELSIFIDNDPVLAFFSRTKNMLHVYTGTNIYRLAIFLNRSNGRLECYSQRDTTHMDALANSEHITLDQLTNLYGTLYPLLPIETLLLIQSPRDRSPSFEWQIVPIRVSSL